jgi:hypothetical protein
MLWIAGVNLVWATIFVGAHRSHRGPGPDGGPEPPRPTDPHGVERRPGRRERRRRRGADRRVGHPCPSSGSRSEPRPIIR